MKKKLRIIWRYSWTITVPLTLILLIWGKATYERWSTFQVRHATSEDFSLLKVGTMQAKHMLRSAKVQLRSRSRADDLKMSGLDTVHLYLEPAEEQSLNSSLPHSGFSYVKGAMFLDNQVQEVKMRYRGDNVYHWGYWKKSWRVKTKKGSLYKGMRKFNLVAPRTAELLNNYLSYRMATYMGLVAPYTEMVNVSLNGGHLGVFILTEQLGESTIRRHDLMPGDVYSGELVGMDAFQGISNQLFDAPSSWSKISANNHFDLESKKPLRKLLDLVRNSDSEETQQEINDFVDLEAFGRFSAYESLVCTVHIDAVHNWRLYYDPWETKMMPIVWDPVGWHRTMIPRPGVPFRPDVITSPLHQALFRNPEFLRARDKAFEDFFRLGNDRIFLNEVEELMEGLPLALRHDPNLVAELKILDSEGVEQAMAKLLGTIKVVFDGVHSTFLEDRAAEVRYAEIDRGQYALTTSGRRPLQQVALTFDEVVVGPVQSRIQWYRSDGTPESVDVTGATQVIGNRVVFSADLIASQQENVISLLGIHKHKNGLIVEPGYYELIVDSTSDLGNLVEVRTLREGVDVWEVAGEAQDLSPTGMGSLHALVKPVPLRTPTVWSGHMEITGTIEVDGDLTILPGTTLSMHPESNILIHGRLKAEGTAEQPIRFEPFEEGQDPWGVVALKGQGADGSVLKHCNFKAGSGWKMPLAEFSAMLSVHSVQKMKVVDCLFEDSKLVDDMVHGVYSDIHFLRCRFINSLSDALDMDISTTLVEDCLFLGSGGDAVDLMTAQATVVGTILDSSTDKGVSSGENSRVLVIDSLFRRCGIGIQAKDRSEVSVFNSDFVECDVAFDAYKKNWRYGGGGKAFVHKSRFIDNTLPIRMDSNSRITVVDSGIDRAFEYNERRIKLHPTVSTHVTGGVKSKRVTLLPGESIVESGGARPLSRINANVRGSTLYSGEADD